MSVFRWPLGGGIVLALIACGDGASNSSTSSGGGGATTAGAGGSSSTSEVSSSATQGTGGNGGNGGLGGQGGSGGTHGSGGSGGQSGVGGGGTGGAGGGLQCSTPLSHGGPVCARSGNPLDIPTMIPCPPCPPTPGAAEPACSSMLGAECAYCTGAGQAAEVYRCTQGVWSTIVSTAHCADCPAGGGIAPPPGLITNIDPQSCVSGFTLPLQGEDGHLATTRLVPANYPATVGKIRYQLISSPSCQALPHRVDVFVASTVAPPAIPTVLQSFNVPANAAGPDFKIELSLTNAITLTAGQYLFVAVEQKRTGVSHTCMATCGGPTHHPDRNYWSNATAPPYPWATMASFNINTDYLVEALP